MVVWFSVVVGGYLGWSRGWFLPRTGGVPYTDEELDGMTRLLLAETSFLRPENESVAIVQTAVNRSKKSGSILSAVTPPGSPMNWNNSDKFRDKWNESKSYPQWDRTRVFVKKVLDGGYPNRIGDRTMFLHPRGMKRPNTKNKNCKGLRRSKFKTSTTSGPRCLPKWSTGSSVVVIDGARFSYPA